MAFSLSKNHVCPRCGKWVPKRYQGKHGLLCKGLGVQKKGIGKPSKLRW
jgi:hypothetical protein